MKLSHKSVAMRAALGAYLRPLLAQDGAIPQLRAIVRGNKKPAFVAMDAKSVFADKLDIDVEALTKVLQLAADEAEEDKDDKASKDEEEETAEEKAAREKKEKDDADKKKADDEEDDDAKAKAKEDDKKANDAAIRLAADNARTSALSEFRAIRQAEQDVQPLVGAVVAMDSAEEIYRFALDSVGIENKGVHASALPTLVSMAKERKAAPAPRVAMDASHASDFAARFPNATKLARA